ncbi:hypothetical protein BJV85_000371 [Clostridium acetobutylicum]|uniref:DUF4238 domain-containing protein n=1 Tax=Clostridium acetobutylicum (strain ATCC 824 / DSM 792 / JCM 1419 / IAM 19013 / LMG 5710 / NBRC 13948 / NRRL B-527 / VKM B-1787 / 2291 / W) TaxID=272562 RepID=Q97DE8_CLOAB|nr:MULTISPECIES: DUF4238 domain-containing protein [Clostridium]AAK81455.1 Hypothetical protein CA_C3529 [Clostridium acetobutylicum ATCC 824]ADZ22573.1 Conserved hypothetical protein [Clostridium acetobutylicum EA 2018]AEI32914.1 hypothetical protein SMB_G3570 [Clostridium acetobutylicum DSM 1731]AWV80872.1 DUF4238 domain-containing protein [Clostridium acetobutylicum]MBC2393800.1 DUF4238 domain-containing protein [Clostridium acetobutylicum]
MTNQKYHHLIPRTYLKAWCYNKDSIYVFDTKNRIFEGKNIKKNFGITQFHSIVAGMPICEEEDLKKIYKCLDGYEIYYEGRLLTNLMEYNKYYCKFAEWVIKSNNIDISRKNKNILRAKIDKVKILDIEQLWSEKYEDKWNIVRENIEY